MKKLLPAVLLLAALFFGIQQEQAVEDGGAVVASSEQLATSNDSNWRSGRQVSGTGTVDRVLSDDNDGSRHQRFILRLSSGRSVLVAHNIDLAPRIRSIAQGDSVSFYGQFETNDRGGVIHWTHRDPQGRHVDGWLEHNGRRYQ
jgi:hypothetical protein